MFLLSFTAVQLYQLQQERNQAARLFEAKVKDTETPAFVTREAPAYIRRWVLDQFGRRDVSSDKPLTLSCQQGQQLREYLLGRNALGATAARGAVGGVMGNIPGVKYRLGEIAMKALEQAIRDFGIEIKDDRR